MYLKDVINHKPMTMKKTILLLSLALITFSSYSQERWQKAEYWNTWQYTPKPDKVLEFEKAAAEKTKKFNSTENNLIITYKVVTGPNNGAYLRVMPYQKSKDYDRDRSKEAKYWIDNVSVFVQKEGSPQRWGRLKWGDINMEGAPKKYLSQHSYIVKQGKEIHFRRWMERIGAIISERRPESTRVVLGLISGGNWQEYVVFNAFDKYESIRKEYDNTWEEEYNKMFGAKSWDNDIENFNASLEMIVGHQVQTLELVESMLPN